jgi:hypothetical protein
LRRECLWERTFCGAGEAEEGRRSFVEFVRTADDTARTLCGTWRSGSSCGQRPSHAHDQIMRLARPIVTTTAFAVILMLDRSFRSMPSTDPSLAHRCRVGAVTSSGVDLARSATSSPLKPKQSAAAPRRTCPGRRDSNQTASNKPGAVHARCCATQPVSRFFCWANLASSVSVDATNAKLGGGA